MREAATAVVHGSADGGKEGPNRALSTGSGAGVAVQPVINTKEFFLDTVQSGFRGGVCLGSVDWKVFRLHGGGPQI